MKSSTRHPLRNIGEWRTVSKISIQHSFVLFCVQHAFSPGNSGKWRVDLELNMQNSFIILFLCLLSKTTSLLCSVPVIRPVDWLKALKCFAFFDMPIARSYLRGDAPSVQMIYAEECTYYLNQPTAKLGNLADASHIAIKKYSLRGFIQALA